MKGIGKKTAERIIVELRDVVAKDLAPGKAAIAARSSDRVEDAVRALQQLGLDPAEARRRVEAHASGADGDLPLSDLVRAALRG